MREKLARAEVEPRRQRTQYSCMACSMMMCLRAQGIDCDEDEVNRTMGARPMQGATWESALACGQHYGMRCTLVTPATVQQLREWTDRNIPVMIAWNPEGRPWSHASVVFDVDDDDVRVADPNIPIPDETVRVIPHSEFYGKWFEKWSDYLVRRPAMAVEREITADGRQVVASAGSHGARDEYVQALTELEVSADMVMLASGRLQALGISPPADAYPFVETIEAVTADIHRWRGDVERRCAQGDLERIAVRVARRHATTTRT